MTSRNRNNGTEIAFQNLNDVRIETESFRNLLSITNLSRQKSLITSLISMTKSHSQQLFISQDEGSSRKDTQWVVFQEGCMTRRQQWLEELRRKRKESQEREHDEFMYQTEVLGRQGLSIPTKDFSGDFQWTFLTHTLPINTPINITVISKNREEALAQAIAMIEGHLPNTSVKEREKRLAMELLHMNLDASKNHPPIPPHIQALRDAKGFCTK